MLTSSILGSFVYNSQVYGTAFTAGDIGGPSDTIISEITATDAKITSPPVIPDGSGVVLYLSNLPDEDGIPITGIITSPGISFKFSSLDIILTPGQRYYVIWMPVVIGGG